MPITREELEARPVYQKLNEAQKAHVRRTIYNNAIRPQYKGRGNSPESKASLIEWGMAAPVTAPPQEISSGAAGVAQGFGRYLLDDGPLGQAKQVAVRAGRAVGLPDPGYQPGVGFVMNLDRKGTGKAFPDPVLAKPGSAAETGLAVGEFAGMVNPFDPVNKILIGKGLAGAGKVAALKAPVLQKAYAAGKMAAQTGAMTAAPIAAGTAALRRSNEGKPILADGGAREIATEGLVGGLAGAGALGAMGAARGIGHAGSLAGIGESLALRTARDYRMAPAPPSARALLPERAGPSSDGVGAIRVPPGGFRDHTMGQRGQQPGTTAPGAPGLLALPQGPMPPRMLTAGREPLALPPASSIQAGPAASYEAQQAALRAATARAIEGQAGERPGTWRPRPIDALDPEVLPIPRRLALPPASSIQAPGAIPRHLDPEIQQARQWGKDLALYDQVGHEPGTTAGATSPRDTFLQDASHEDLARWLTGYRGRLTAAKQNLTRLGNAVRADKGKRGGQSGIDETMMHEAHQDVQELPQRITELEAEITRRALRGEPFTEPARRTRTAPEAPLSWEEVVRRGEGAPPGRPTDAPAPDQAGGAAESLGRLADDLEGKGRRILKDTQGRLLSGPGFDPDRLAGHALVASARIIREGVKFGTWAREMVTEHGEAITSHLRVIWDEAQRLANASRPAPAQVPDAPPGGQPDPFAAKAAGAVDAMAAEKPQPTGERFAGSLNLDHIGSTRDLDGLFEAVHRVYENEVTAQRRGQVPHEVTKAIASQLGMSVESVLKMKKGETFKSAAHGLAARDLLESSAERLNKVLEAYDPATSTKEAKLQAVEAMRLHAAIQAKVSGAISETARALNAMRIDARSSAGRLKQIDEALQRAGGEQALDDVLGAAKSLSGEARAKFVSKAHRKNFLSAIAEYYTASLLSAPDTWAVNIIGSAVSSGLRVAETLAAAGVGTVTRRKGVYAGEARAELVGMAQAWREALEAAGRTVKGEDGPGAPGASTERYDSAIPGKAGEVIRTPLRIMEGGDVFFKTVLFRAELYGRAHRQAAGEGLRGPKLEARAAELVSDPPAEMFDAAVEASRYHTFSQALSDKRGPFRPINWIGNSVLSIKAKDPTGLSGVPMPFVRTPANLTKYALERTPAALASVSTWKRVLRGFAKDAKPEEMADMNLALGRIAMGTMAMAYFGSLAKDGMITGNGPVDWRENKALRATGWQPQSFRVGGEYYSYQRLDPLATPLALAADMATLDKFGKDKGLGGQAYAALGSLIKNLADKTYFQSIASLVLALKDPERYLPNYVGGMAAGFVPNALNRVGQGMDNTLRETKGETDVETTLNKMRARIPPGLGIGADTLPEDLDPFGKPAKRDAEGLEVVSPFRRSAGKDSPALAELARLNVQLPEGPPSISLEDGGPKMALSQEQRREYHRMAGPLYEKVLTKVLEAPGYQQLGDEDRVKVIHSLTRQVRDHVAQQFLAEHPDDVRAAAQSAPPAPAFAGASR